MADTDKLFQKAEKLLQKQKFDSAFEMFLKLFKDEPGNEAVLLNLADLSVRFDKLQDSLRYNGLLVQLYVTRKDISKAIVTCRKILKTAPQDVPTLVTLALLLKQSRNMTEAADAFRESAEAYRRNGDTRQAMECLRHFVDLEPGNLEAQTELAQLAADAGDRTLAATAFLKAAGIARKNGMQERWEELAESAHQLDPSNEAGCVTAAEVCLARDRNREAIAILEPISKAAPGDSIVLKLLCQAYLDSGDYARAEPLCRKLYQAQPETVGLTQQLIQGLLAGGETSRALALLEGIKEQMYCQQGKKSEFLALAEQIYHADENNLEVLELLPPIYNGLNREGPLRLALTRLFNLYLAGERYDRAAETLESILDVDPYGAAHSDRVLNLEGHIDAIWYKTIAARISLPGIGHGHAPGLSEEERGETEPGIPATLDDLIVEAEMYHRYHLTAKLEELLRKIDRLHPGACQDNESLNELFELAGIQPAPFERPLSGEPAGSEDAPAPVRVDELGKISSITAIIHRQVTPERVLATAAEQLGKLVDASRCWIGTGPLDYCALTAEYVAPGFAPSAADAALTVCSFLTEVAAIGPEGWAVDNVSSLKQLEPIAPQLRQMGIASFLAVPVMDKEQKAGLLLVEQCQTPRRWTDGEKMLARTVASQVAIAINSTRLRRMVRSLAGTDPATGLLPRSAYLDCLLAEARRAKEESRPFSVCLMEPPDAAGLYNTLGEAEMQSYMQQVGKTVSSCLRQNDIAIRYGPYTVALCLPDTPLEQSRAVIERLQAQLEQTKTGTDVQPAFCAAVADVFPGKRFDAVDAVTEIINRLEASLCALRKQPEGGILLSEFEG